MCFLIITLNNETLKYSHGKVKFYILVMNRCEGCGGLARIRTLIYGVVFTKATLILVQHIINFDFSVIVTSGENLNSQRSSIVSRTHCFHSSLLYQMTIGSLKEHQNSSNSFLSSTM